jgi:hypothetical protein
MLPLVIVVKSCQAATLSGYKDAADIKPQHTIEVYIGLRVYL